MFNIDLVMSSLIRISIVMIVGWILLWYLRRHNPLWSVWIVRSMATLCFLLPLIHLVCPSIPFCILPANPRPASIETTDRPELAIRTVTPIDAPQTELTSMALRSPSASGLVDANETSASRTSQQTVLKHVEKHENLHSRGSASTTGPGIANRLEIGFVLFGVWFFAWFMLVARIFVEVWSAHRLLSNSRCLSEVEAERIRRLDRPHGERRAGIRINNALDCPSTGGVFRPCIYLAEDWIAERTDDQLQAILAHEQAHVDGRDLFWDLVCRVAVAVWWFLPLVWRLPRHHRLSCELVSDAIAGASIDNIPLYRRWLAQWTIASQKQEKGTSLSTAGLFAMARRSMMIQRLGVLKRGYRGTSPSRLQIASMLLFSIVIGVVVALTSVTRRAIAAPPVQPQTQTFETASESEANAKKIIVRVEDEAGEPIPDASVAAGRWEFADKSEQSVSMNDPKHVNEDGEVSFTGPEKATKAVFWAKAKGYAEASEYVSTSDQITIVLKSGRQIRVRVIDEDGKAVRSAMPVLENGNRWPSEFTPIAKSPGAFLSPAIIDGRNSMYVIDKVASDDGKIHYSFSDWIDLSKPNKQDADGTIVVEIRPGIRLCGQLDDIVPRPIKFGFVELCVAGSLQYNNKLKVGSRWRDRVAIKPDGSFEFAGVPFGTHAQIFAFADGHLSVPPTDQELIGSLKEAGLDEKNIEDQMSGLRKAYLPRFVRLDSKNTLSKNTIELKDPVPCVPTASVDVKVVDASGDPIENAIVSFNPNGRFFGADLFIAGTDGMLDSHRFSGLGGSLSDSSSLAAKCWKWASESFHNIATDAKGIAQIHDLPIGFREGYHVKAKGYVMPVHPTSLESDIELSTLDRESPYRYAAVDLVSGQTQKRTVTMERFVQRCMREVNLVLEDGKPATGVKVAVTELTYKSAPDQWLAWSVSRFGAMAGAESNEVGLARLDVPLEVEGNSIAQLRVAVSGHVNGSGFVSRQYCVLPIVNDNGVLRLSEEPKKSSEQRRSTYYRVDYVKLDDVFSSSKKNLLDQLQQSPSLALLMQLLQANSFEAATPLKFRPDRNLLGPNGMPVGHQTRQHKEKGTSIAEISTASGGRVVVLCDVRPKGETWEKHPWSGHPPEAALIFDASTGDLIRMIGGEFSASENTSSVMLINMGGSDDHFVETSFFENHSPFEMLTRWYHLGREKSPTLTSYNHANATSWMGKRAVSQPPGEFGYMNYGFNGERIDYWLPGTTPNGITVPRKIYWDAKEDLFVGPTTQSYQGKPLYRVIEKESAAFEAFQPEPTHMIIGGGRTEDPTDYQWDIVIPEGKKARFQIDELENVDADTPTPSLASYALTEGANTIQLRITPSKEDDSKSMLSTYLNYRSGDSPKRQMVPKVSSLSSQSAKPWRAIRSSKTSVDLVFLETDSEGQPIRVRVDVE